MKNSNYSEVIDESQMSIRRQPDIQESHVEYLDTSQIQNIGIENELSEEFQKKQEADNSKMLMALDIFMLLNKNNDGYIQIEETVELEKIILSFPDQSDRGNIDNEESFQRIFESMNLKNIDAFRFKYFLDKMDCCCKHIRGSMVQGKLKELQQGQIVNKSKFKCCINYFRGKVVEEKINKLLQQQNEGKSKFADMVTIVKSVQASIVEGLDVFTDIVVLNKIYWEGMKPENRNKDGYKIATVVIFISICSCFLIAYSSIINMLLFNGVYEPAQIKRQSYCLILLRLLFLTFIGPFYFVFIEITNKLMAICSLFGLIFGKNGHLRVKNFFLAFIKKVFGLNQEQCEGLEVQRGIVQLCFESIPMIILQIFIRKGYLDLGNLFKNEGSVNALFISLVTTSLSVFFVLLNISIESKAFDEDLLEYTLNCFKARQQWIPFVNQIRKLELNQVVNYSKLVCQYPQLTGKCGVYKLFLFRFTDISLQKLGSELVKWENQVYGIDDDEYNFDSKEIAKDKYIMDIGGSIQLCTLNMVINFYKLVPINKINIRLTNVSWTQLLQNSIAMDFVAKSLNNNGKSTMKTLSGQDLLWVCVDNEQSRSKFPNSIDIYNEAVKILYKDQLAKIILDIAERNNKIRFQNNSDEDDELFQIFSKELKSSKFAHNIVQKLKDLINLNEGGVNYKVNVCDTILDLTKDIKNQNLLIFSQIDKQPDDDDDDYHFKNHIFFEQMNSRLNDEIITYHKQVSEFEFLIMDMEMMWRQVALSQHSIDFILEKYPEEFKLLSIKLRKIQDNTYLMVRVRDQLTLQWIKLYETSKQSNFNIQRWLNDYEVLNQLQNTIQDFKSEHELNEIVEELNQFLDDVLLIKKDNLGILQETEEMLMKEEYEDLLDYLKQVYDSLKDKLKLQILGKRDNGYGYNNDELLIQYGSRKVFYNCYQDQVRSLTPKANELIDPDQFFKQENRQQFLEAFLVKNGCVNKTDIKKQKDKELRQYQQINARRKRFDWFQQSFEDEVNDFTKINSKDEFNEALKLLGREAPDQELVTQFQELNMPQFDNPCIWVFEDCFKMLVQYEENSELMVDNFSGCDMNIKDNFGQTLLIHAIKTFKNKSVSIMIKQGVDIQLQNDSGITPLAQAIISKNFEILHLLLQFQGSFQQEFIKDRLVSSKKIRPIEYIFIEDNDLSEDDLNEITKILTKNKVKLGDQDREIILNVVIKKLHNYSTCYSEEDKEFLQGNLKICRQMIDGKKFNLSMNKNQNENDLFIKALNQIIYDGIMKWDSYDILMDLILHSDLFCHDNQQISKIDLRNILKKLLCNQQDIINNEYSIFEIALKSCHTQQVNKIAEEFVEKFDKNQEQLAIQYIYDKLNRIFRNHQEYKTYYDTNKEFYEPIKSKFSDWDIVQKAVIKLAQEDINRTAQTYYNLEIFGFISENHNFEIIKPSWDNKQSDKQKDYLNFNFSNQQEVLITQHQENLNGQFMRYKSPLTDQKILYKEKISNIEQQLEKGKNKKIANEIDPKQIIQQKKDVEKTEFEMRNDLNLKINEFDVPFENKSGASKYFELVFNILLELIALFDMVGDIYALLLTYKLGHIAWFSISVFTMISPFYVCYVPLLTFQKERAEQILDDSMFQKVLALFSLSPLIVINLLVMDLIYIFNSVIITPLVFIFTIGRVKQEQVEEKIDTIYNLLFGMSDMDIKGFRRLRTISQLTFESFPQILLQIRILFYQFGQNQKLGIDAEAIIISLACAIAHAIFEIIFLHLEAISCKTTKIHYTIVCFNARFGWIPFNHYFSSLTKADQLNDQTDVGLQQNIYNKRDIDLNYEGMRSALCGINFQMKFKFSDATCKVLKNSISNLQIEKVSDYRLNVKIGASLNDVSFQSLFDLAQIAYMRINLDLSEVDIKSMLHHPTNKHILDQLQNPIKEELYIQDYQIIQKVVHLSQKDILKQILSINKVDLDVKPDLVTIAKRNQDYQILKILINSPQFTKNKDLLVQFNKYLNGNSSSLNFENIRCDMERGDTEWNVILYLSAFLSCPEITMTQQQQLKLLSRLFEELKLQRYDRADQLMICAFGYQLPLNIIKGQGLNLYEREQDYQYFIDNLKQYDFFFQRHKQRMNHQVYLKFEQTSSVPKIIAISANIVSCFAVLREKIFCNWPLDHMLFSDEMIGGKRNPFNLFEMKINQEAFKLVCLLISDDHEQVGNLTPSQVQQCDKVIEKLNLDQCKEKYFAQSRLNDQSIHSYQIEVNYLSLISLDKLYDDWYKKTKGDVNEYIKLNAGITFFQQDQEEEGGLELVTYCVLDYQLPNDVLAVQSFQIDIEYTNCYVILKLVKQNSHLDSLTCISSSLQKNKWWNDLTYCEKISHEQCLQEISKVNEPIDNKLIVSNAKGGDKIQIYLEVQTYDRNFNSSQFEGWKCYCQNIQAKISVIKKIENQTLSDSKIIDLESQVEKISTVKIQNTPEQKISKVVPSSTSIIYSHNDTSLEKYHTKQDYNTLKSLINQKK